MVILLDLEVLVLLELFFPRLQELVHLPQEYLLVFLEDYNVLVESQVFLQVEEMDKLVLVEYFQLEEYRLFLEFEVCMFQEE